MAELAKIEAALKRAAYKAVHGTQFERSGRFWPEGTVKPAQKIHKNEQPKSQSLTPAQKKSA